MVTAIFPVVAPEGTTAVNCLSELMVTLTDFPFPNFTFVVPFRLSPLITTDVPGPPLEGLRLSILGRT